MERLNIDKNIENLKTNEHGAFKHKTKKQRIYTQKNVENADKHKEINTHKH